MMIKVADEVWIGTALLHYEHAERHDFANSEILERIRQEQLHPYMRPGVQIHLTQHCVANKPAMPGAYKMLWETGRGRRRLFRHSDEAHLDRRGKTLPEAQDIPENLRYLISWYNREYDGNDYAQPDASQLLITPEQLQQFNGLFGALLSIAKAEAFLIETVDAEQLAEVVGSQLNNDEPHVERLVSWMQKFFVAHNKTESGSGGTMPHKVYARIVQAVKLGQLNEPFSRHDFRSVCPGLGEGTYNAFLDKHALGNPGANSELFERIAPGQFRCTRPFKYNL